jgi:hypothetical protein
MKKKASRCLHAFLDFMRAASVAFFVVGVIIIWLSVFTDRSIPYGSECVFWGVNIFGWSLILDWIFPAYPRR